MPSEQTPTPVSTPDIKSVIAELEVPFPPDQVQWRVTNTAKDKRRGQVVPYADPRAYAVRLNALFTPQGWTRHYKVENDEQHYQDEERREHRERKNPGDVHGDRHRPMVAFGYR